MPDGKFARHHRLMHYAPATKRANHRLKTSQECACHKRPPTFFSTRQNVEASRVVQNYVSVLQTSKRVLQTSKETHFAATAIGTAIAPPEGKQLRTQKQARANTLALPDAKIKENPSLRMWENAPWWRQRTFYSKKCPFYHLSTVRGPGLNQGMASEERARRPFKII